MFRFGCCGKTCGNRPPLPDWLVGAVVVFLLAVMTAFMGLLFRTLLF